MQRRMVPQSRLLLISSKLIVVALTLCVAIIAALVPSGVTSASEESDRDALVALYQDTDGDNWHRNDNWLTDEPLDTWYGITTDWRGRVVALDLLENGLTGPIPPELGNVTGLVWLDLSDNSLRGSIPPGLGNLVKLEALYLDSNQLSGSIPPDLGNLVNLMQLFLSNNQLSGAIPPELSNLTRLEGLSLWGNHLKGSLPTELSNLRKLSFVLLGLGNQLSGCVPESWRSAEINDFSELGLSYCSAPAPTLIITDREVLVALYHATNGVNWLRSDNWLTEAPIETWYGVTTDTNGRVVELALPENELNGEIPSELGELTNLEWLDLSENELRGEIPSELGNLDNLTDLYLNSNRLSGAIPTELGNLASLEFLALTDNWLSGPIPPELGKLVNLKGLALAFNELSGSIPPELSNLVSLEGLALSWNRLSGVIPPELGSLSKLTLLYLSDTQLSGCAPGEWRSIEESDLEELGLPFCVVSATTTIETSGSLTSVQIFEKVSPAIAFIETATSAGSGVLVEGGYLITNAHVVWPYNEARVVFPDGAEFEEVPVTSWDNLADLAVLGPISRTANPATLIDGEDLPVGADVYLIGYPGEFEDFPQPAIGRGLLARLREWESIGITYFQTDAVAIGGQSGGALVSAMGDVIGISGFRITEGSFGFVASAADLLPRIRKMVAGEDPSGLGDRRLPIEVRRHRLKLRNYWDDLVFLIEEPVGTRVEVELTGERGGRVSVYDSSGEEFLDLDEENTDSQDGTFVVKANEPHFLVVRQVVELPSLFTLEVNRRIKPFSDPDRGVRLQVGKSVRGNIDFPGDVDHFLLQLEENEVVEIVGRSALADIFLTVDYLGATSEQIVQDDDSGGGLFGLDSKVVYQAPHSGSYFLVVRDAGLSAPGGYIISVEEAGQEANFQSRALSEFGFEELHSSFVQLLSSYEEFDPALLDFSLEEMAVLAAEGQFSHLVTFMSSEGSQVILVASGHIGDFEKTIFDRDLNGLAQVLLSDSRGDQGGSDRGQLELLEISQVGSMSLGVVHETVSDGERQRVETVTFRRENLVAFIQTFTFSDSEENVSVEEVARALDAQMGAYLSGE